MSWKKEIGRKAIHLSWGLVLYFYLQLEKTHGKNALLLPFGLLILFLLIDFFRIQYKFKLPVVGKLLHDKEAARLFTPTTTMLAITIALAALSREIAIAAILIMVLGDVAANIVGKLFGRTKIGDKTLEGATAFLAVSFITGLWVIQNPLIAAAMASIAAATELFTTELDDNMLVILFSGAAGQAMLLFL